MSVDSRPNARLSRRGKKDDDRPDYSEPDFNNWAAKLDGFVAAKQAEAPIAAPNTSVMSAAMPAGLLEGAIDDNAFLPTFPTAPASRERVSLEATLEDLLNFDGAMCVAVVDSDSGMVLGKAGAGVDIDLAAAGASTILRARLASTKALGLTEQIDDLLISLSSQVQIIHPLPRNPVIFTYLIADKARSSLAMARYKATEADLTIQL